MNIPKTLAIAGILLNAIGTILLWRSSPSGYQLPMWGSLRIPV